MKRLAILIVVLLMGPSWAETESLKDIKIQYEIPSGFEVLSKSGSSGVYVHKDRDWQISINGRPASTMRPPENWLASAKKRARKDSKVSELKIPGAVGAYLAQHKKSGKKKFWGRIGLFTKTHTYDITFMTKPTDHKKIEKLARDLAASIRFLK